MKRAFFGRLALKNIRRNLRILLPYLLSCAGMAALFFILHILSITPSLKGVYGGRTLQRAMGAGVWVMGIFALLFMFYTHGFLIKQRKKEFGLFNILGMEKKHIGRMLMIENLLVALVSTLLGLALGALLSRLMYLLILRLLGAGHLAALVLPGKTFVITALVFLTIHLLTLVSTLLQVKANQPIQLLQGASLGERQPRGNLLIALAGFICLGTGYAIAQIPSDPRETMLGFFAAIVLVILGTYALFGAGSVYILKALRKNKRFYYKPRNFQVISGMIHRLHRNAASLASITILSIMVLVMVVVTVSLYTGGQVYVSGNMQREARFTVQPADQEGITAFEELVQEQAQLAGARMDNIVAYRSLHYDAVKVEGQKQLEDASSYVFEEGSQASIVPFQLIPLEDFNLSQQEKASLMPGEALLYRAHDNPLDLPLLLPNTMVDIKEERQDISPIETQSNIFHNRIILIMNLEDILQIHKAQSSSYQAPDGGPDFRLHYAFDTGELAIEAAFELVDNTQKRWASQIMDGTQGFSIRTDGHHVAFIKADFVSFYGSLLFVSVFLGLTFIMALALIIYYKQLSEGMEDKARFDILRKVGMGEAEVRATVRRQVLMVFFIPLIMAGIHLAFSFAIVQRVLALMNLVSGLSGRLIITYLLTFLGFSIIYLFVYAKTSASYYRIVRG